MLSDQAAGWVTEVLGGGSRIVRYRRLRLGGWHVNHALDVIDGDGDTHRLVLRRWARPGWQVDDPDYTVQRETRILELLRPTQLPAPMMIAADPDGTRCDVARDPADPPSRAPTGPGGDRRRRILRPAG